jgi:hypothetical protein
MRTSTFVAIAIAVALLVIAMIYMHRPRAGSSVQLPPLHGGR